MRRLSKISIVLLVGMTTYQKSRRNPNDLDGLPCDMSVRANNEAADSDDETGKAGTSGYESPSAV
jgi:hypothetical protein